MSILYSCYARGTEIVAETGSQKFKKLVKVLLERVEPRARKSYEHEQNSINYISTPDGQVWLAVATKDMNTRVVFAYLEKIQKGGSADSGSLRMALEQYNSQSSDKVKQVQREIDSVKEIMMENIEHVLKRGERLEELMERTENIAQEASIFKRQAGDLKRAMWWKNVKLWIAIGAVLIVVVLIIIFSVCGINFAKCAPSNPPPSQ